MPTPRFLSSTNSVDLATYDFGGAGPLIIICHATGFCAGVYEPMIAALTEHHRVVGLDFRGHGQSSPPENLDFAWQGMGEDLLTFIDHLTADPDVDTSAIRAFGHSMGGCAILMAALLRPGTITGAWAFEPILFDRPDGTAPVQQSPLVEGARRRRPVFDSREEAFERYGSRPPFDAVDPRALQAYVDHGFGDQDDGTVRLRCEPEHEASTFENSFAGVAERVSEIGFPLLVAVSGDGMPPATQAEVIVQRNANFELARYDDLTHFGPMEAPDNIARDVMRFFA